MKYSIEEFKNRLSYESWDSIFSNNDNMDVDSLFNIILNNYLRIITTKMLKVSAPYISSPLNYVYNKSIRT
jgi:hypothetical protein